MTNELDRRGFAKAAGAALAGLGMVGAARARGASEISHTHDAIHQEVAFKASPARVYAVLTDATLFDKVVRLSAAMNSSMKTKLGSASTLIEARPGGAIALFGGYVTGRNLELAPDTRLVQAWRAGSWDPGQFSIAHFALAAGGAGTRLVFDHTGFPAGQADHLAEGWHINYWEPLAKVLAAS
ncbi:MAG TPA: SRPBCC domain-containing protein [Rhizomicrobium sp.]|jgi:uncharacterized protein YndB with AHSA1/START domain